MTTRWDAEKRDKEWAELNTGGVSQKDIAEQFGVSQPYVSARIKRHREASGKAGTKAESSAYILLLKEIETRRAESEWKSVDWGSIDCPITVLKVLGGLARNTPSVFIGRWHEKITMKAMARYLELQHPIGNAQITYNGEKVS